jgi:hypothetical protein
MSGAMPPLPNTPSWRGAQLKAQGQLYLRKSKKVKGRETCIVLGFIRVSRAYSTHRDIRNAYKILD